MQSLKFAEHCNVSCPTVCNASSTVCSHSQTSLGVVSAPLWNSEKSCFAGMFTVSDIIHLIQYYYKSSTYEGAAADVETLCLESLRGESRTSFTPSRGSFAMEQEIEKELGVEPPPLLREHPSATLYDAAKLLIQTHARRLPLLDNDSETGHEVIVSVLTQYRLLKFISINVGLLISSFTSLADCRHSAPGKSRNCTCRYGN